MSILKDILWAKPLFHMILLIYFMHLHCSSNFMKISTSVQLSSVVQWCATLCDPMDCSTPGFPVHHQLPEVLQTLVHWVGDAIQPSNPLLSPSPPAFKLFQNWYFPMSQFFASDDQASPSVLSMNIQDWFTLECTDWISLQFKGLLTVFSNATVQKHQFFSPQLSL